MQQDTAGEFGFVCLQRRSKKENSGSRAHGEKVILWQDVFQGLGRVGLGQIVSAVREGDDGHGAAAKAGDVVGGVQEAGGSGGDGVVVLSLEGAEHAERELEGPDAAARDRESRAWQLARGPPAQDLSHIFWQHRGPRLRPQHSLHIPQIVAVRRSRNLRPSPVDVLRLLLTQPLFRVLRDTRAYQRAGWTCDKVGGRRGSC